MGASIEDKCLTNGKCDYSDPNLIREKTDYYSTDEANP